MAEFSIQDAAFTGFRVVREHPRALGVWALYAFVVSLMLAVLLVGLMGPDLTRLTAAGPRDPAQVLAILGRLAPAYALFVLVSLATNAVLSAAMIRAVLRPADTRFGFLRLGGDELRQLGLGLLVFLLFLGVSTGLFLIFGLIAGVVGVAVKAPPILVGLAVLLGVGALCVALAIRLSLAPPLTFDRERIDLFGSWSLTRNRFWPLVLTYGLTFALVIVVYVLSLLVIFAVGAVITGGNPITSLTHSDMTSLGAYFSPLRWVQTVLGAGVSALVWPVLLTPPTSIYRRLAPSGVAAADVFS